MSIFAVLALLLRSKPHVFGWWITVSLEAGSSTYSLDDKTGLCDPSLWELGPRVSSFVYSESYPTIKRGQVPR